MHEINAPLNQNIDVLFFKIDAKIDFESSIFESLDKALNHPLLIGFTSQILDVQFEDKLKKAGFSAVVELPLDQEKMSK